ncbi:RNA polymerase sigma factor sigF, chloroplastic [Apostasia shenzhenica]|uniref:RNA polymerase sigma factor sigF, chloroplastic n=1 Tax=Apostasia shenzhenica TaxID=1088818 RepID=A0A2H9ZXM1_9ASPA|nr:RNA polymerase sigma factor sigF, chloroplastic [Apostasia shenzhenica]
MAAVASSTPSPFGGLRTRQGGGCGGSGPAGVFRASTQTLPWSGRSSLGFVPRFWPWEKVKIWPLSISPMGFGTRGNQLLWGYEEDDFLQDIFHLAVRNGITFFDSVDSYGTGSEMLLGRFTWEYKGKLYLIGPRYHHLTSGLFHPFPKATLDRQPVEDGLLSPEDGEKHDFDQFLKNLECRLTFHPRTTALKQTEQDGPSTVSLQDALALAKRAVMASREAALLAENSPPHKFIENIDPSLDPSASPKDITDGNRTVRSNKLLERQAKKRKVVMKPKDNICRASPAMSARNVRKIKKMLSSNDPLRLFLLGPETKELLTIKEEEDLLVNDLMQFEAIKKKLRMQFDREPTLVEWAQAIGMSCQDLQSCISLGVRSRNRLICANFRLVVHVARHYEGNGISIQDLLQEGSVGLMKSLEKFKPKAGCRFPTYAYWWIRQSMRKAIFQHSRTIRLPENVFALMRRIKDAKRVCLQEGLTPTNEELAKKCGISLVKLANLFMITKNPVSIDRHAWIDGDATFQEITADPGIEIPEKMIGKKMMRQHVLNLLGVLSSRERKIIKLRFGIQCSEPKTLSEIGGMLGLTKERIRQLESRALEILRECLSGQGIEAYTELLT